MSEPAIELGLCQCGCGQKTPLSKRDRAERGYKKGDPQRFLRGHSARVYAKYPPICTLDGCDRDTFETGLCGIHYGEVLRRRKGVEPRWDSTFRDEAGRKRCSTCREFKPESEFHRTRSATDGLMSFCRLCYRTHYRDGTASLREKRRLRDIYIERQGGMCAVCREPFATEGNAPALDHDHACCPADQFCEGCVRGALCHLCNLAIGALKEDRDRFIGAILYLFQWEVRQKVAVPVNGGYSDCQSRTGDEEAFTQGVQNG